MCFTNLSPPRGIYHLPLQAAGGKKGAAKGKKGAADKDEVLEPALTVSTPESPKQLRKRALIVVTDTKRGRTFFNLFCWTQR